MQKIRCAIYTRKSSDEGLEQGFNSLDAQREACAAYVLSQASEGWQLLPDFYDDGGISGGTLERPALQQLLTDIAAGRIDIVVVYKVDRLTRALLDFAKLVEAFDKAGVSFVSITQSFNTTTSMGRLTLNMLLSFAQFEREIAAERIRDKIAASKAKGMWMGGNLPLGYKPDGRSLAIVEEHAALIRDIYRRYIETGNVRRVAEQLEGEGVHTPQRSTLTGRDFGGSPFSRGQIYKILSNPIYLGEIPHQGKLHKGLHQPIIERETWDHVQLLLTEHTRGEERVRLPNKSLLAGLIVDAAGEPMYATHAKKGDVRYRYYVSRSLQLGEADKAQGIRLPAREIEGVVKEQVGQLFDDPLLLASQLSLGMSPALLRQMSEQCRDIARTARSRSGGPVRDFVARVRARDRRLEIELAVDKIADALGYAAGESAPTPLTLKVEFRLTRTGNAIRLVQGNGARSRPGETDVSLVKLVLQARKWWSILCEGQIKIAELARREGVTRSYVCRVIDIAFLSPSVIDAVFEGRQRGDLDAVVLRQTDAVPARWDEQAVKFLPKAAEGTVGLGHGIH